LPEVLVFVGRLENRNYGLHIKQRWYPSISAAISRISFSIHSPF